ncbi:hypothetical protein PCE1_003810 [Barthelona sp. PCE]
MPRRLHREVIASGLLAGQFVDFYHDFFYCAKAEPQSAVFGPGIRDTPKFYIIPEACVKWDISKAALVAPVHSAELNDSAYLCLTHITKNNKEKSFTFVHKESGEVRKPAYDILKDNVEYGFVSINSAIVQRYSRSEEEAAAEMIVWDDHGIERSREELPFVHKKGQIHIRGDSVVFRDKLTSVMWMDMSTKSFSESYFGSFIDVINLANAFVIATSKTLLFVVENKVFDFGELLNIGRPDVQGIYIETLELNQYSATGIIWLMTKFGNMRAEYEEGSIVSIHRGAGPEDIYAKRRYVLDPDIPFSCPFECFSIDERGRHSLRAVRGEDVSLFVPTKNMFSAGHHVFFDLKGEYGYPRRSLLLSLNMRDCIVRAQSIFEARVENVTDSDVIVSQHNSTYIHCIQSDGTLTKRVRIKGCYSGRSHKGELICVDREEWDFSSPLKMYVDGEEFSFPTEMMFLISNPKVLYSSDSQKIFGNSVIDYIIQENCFKKAKLVANERFWPIMSKTEDENGDVVFFCCDNLAKKWFVADTGGWHIPAREDWGRPIMWLDEKHVLFRGGVVEFDGHLIYRVVVLFEQWFPQYILKENVSAQENGVWMVYGFEVDRFLCWTINVEHASYVYSETLLIDFLSHARFGTLDGNDWNKRDLSLR